MLAIRLQRTGRKNLPTYRLVVAEHSAPVKGKFLEILGVYIPTREGGLQWKEDRIRQWIQKGARPSNTAARLLKKNGVSGMEDFIKRYTKKISTKEAAQKQEAQGEAVQKPAAEKVDAPAPQNA